MRQAAVLRRAIALLACIAGSAPIVPAASPAAFTLALDGPVAAAHAPYLHAIASGAYAAAGLAVSIRYPEGQGGALGTLVSGGADACIADAVSILAARAGGAKITIVASIGDLHPACVVSRAESAITTPASLAGRRVAVGPLDADRLLFPLFLAGAGLRADDVTTVPLDDAGREAALAAGTVDAVLDRLGSGRPGIAILPWAAHGFALYGPCLAVRDETLRTRPTTVRAFLKQTLATWEACLQEPAAAAQSAAASGLVTPRSRGSVARIRALPCSTRRPTGRKASGGSTGPGCRPPSRRYAARSGSRSPSRLPTPSAPRTSPCPPCSGRSTRRPRPRPTRHRCCDKQLQIAPGCRTVESWHCLAGSNRIFVLDTNVPLHDHDCIHSFEEHNVVIPITVLEEIDKFKRGNEVLNFNAREFSRKLDALVGDRLLSEGIRLAVRRHGPGGHEHHARPVAVAAPSGRTSRTTASSPSPSTWPGSTAATG